MILLTTKSYETARAMRYSATSVASLHWRTVMWCLAITAMPIGILTVSTHLLPVCRIVVLS